MKHYLKEIDEYFSIFKQIKLSIVVALGLLIIDILDLPTKLIFIYGYSIVMLVIFGILTILNLTLFENGVLHVFKISIINQLDVLIYLILLSSAIYSSVSSFLGIFFLYKQWIFGISLSITLSFAALRCWKINHAQKKSSTYQSNVDLKDLLEQKEIQFRDNLILIDEKEVDYDLLERERIINYLYNTIVSTKPDGKFVISLQGKWGSGKTTIIRNVKKMLLKNNPEIVIIDEFDPWVFSDENTLLKNMLDVIIKKSGYGYNNIFAGNVAKDLSELLLGHDKSNFFNSFFLENGTLDIKFRINKYLKSNDRKFVFIIDNIDRIEKENVLLLFRIVGSILDFERITYVLCFDEDRVKKIFEKNLSIDYDYIKKIINLQIQVPKIDKHTLRKIYSMTLKKILVGYGENESDFENYESLIDLMCSQELDIRDFKRFINSSVSFSFKTNHFLYKKDLLAMEYIKLFNFPLYMSIFNNRIYFISHDKERDAQYYKILFKEEDFNLQVKTFFGDLFNDDKNRDFQMILSELFPHSNCYYGGKKIIDEFSAVLKDSIYEEILKRKRICSAKYFDLYFTGTDNTFIEIAKTLEEFIEECNQDNSLEEKEKVFYGKLQLFHDSYQKEFFERLQIYENEIKSEYIYDLIKLLFKNIGIIDDTKKFLELSPRSRVTSIIHDLLTRITEVEYNDFLRFVSKKYNRLQILGDILYWFSEDCKEVMTTKRRELLEKNNKNMVDTVLNTGIDLYDDVNYVEKNIWGLYYVYKEKPKIIKSYMKSILNKKNIFRFLNDMMGVAISDEYRYYINKTNAEYFVDCDEIDRILNHSRPETEDEKFVADVYWASTKEEEDSYKNSGIKLDYEKKLKL